MIRLLLLAPLLLTGCFAHFSGNVQTGQYSGTFIGADAQGFAQTAAGVNSDRINTSDGFRELNKTGRFLGGVAQFGGVAKTGINAYQKVSTAKTSASVATNAAKEVTNQAAIQATTDQARIAAEAAALAAP